MSSSSQQPKLYALIAGVGAGTGAAVTHLFAKTYPTIVLARNPESYESLVEEINGSGGWAMGVVCDVSDGGSIKKAFERIEEVMGVEGGCAAAIFNASGKLTKKPFLELSLEEFSSPYLVNCQGGFLFSQAVLPKLLHTAQNLNPQYPPTLIFTGATASLKGSAQFASFAVGKFATRALAQSLAREFAPKGVHVGHVIIDGIIDIPSSKDFMKDAGPDAKIDPKTIADTYWYMHTQPRSGFSHELEIRPFGEKW